MKHIKPYNIFESASTNFPTTRDEVIKVCKRYNIRNYTINDDLSIDVDGVVYLDNRNLEYLPLRFNYVSGGFDCFKNILVSLEGSPLTLGGNFDCGYNELKTLEGSPQTVDGNFVCHDNKLKTLEGSPQTVGGNFNCVNNELKDLEHFPEVNGFIRINKNAVYHLAYTFIYKADSFMIEDFNDYEIVRNRDTVMLDRLQTFIEGFDLEMPDLEEIKKHYKIIE
jgi:hypothetical protein